jgi:peptidyl-tRNA hydrolase
MNESRENRIVQYIVIPRSLKMTPGKVGATCGHAVQLFMQAYSRRRERHGSTDERCQMVDAWLLSSYPKIILGASDEDFVIVRHLDDAIAVIDVGLKEVAPGSVTAVVFWPMWKFAAASILQEMRPL